MRYRELGNTGWHISEIGFGCMSLSGTEPGDIRLIHQAMAAGINYFDTADLYQLGANETLLGKALQGKRSEVFLATKVGNEWQKDGSWKWNPGKEYILRAAEQSLQRLGTDYIDLYQLHGGTLEDPVMETIEAFEILKQQGKIRHYGISSIRPNVIREYAAKSRLVSVMMQYSLLDRRPEESCMALLREKNIGILARGVLAKGLLGGKPPAPFPGYSLGEVQKMQQAITAFTGASPARVAIQWVLRHPALSAAVIGIRTPQQLEDVLEKPGEPPLTDEEFVHLSSILPPRLYDQHR